MFKIPAWLKYPICFSMCVCISYFLMLKNEDCYEGNVRWLDFWVNIALFMCINELVNWLTRCANKTAEIIDQSGDEEGLEYQDYMMFVPFRDDQKPRPSDMAGLLVTRSDFHLCKRIDRLARQSHMRALPTASVLCQCPGARVRPRRGARPKSQR